MKRSAITEHSFSLSFTVNVFLFVFLLMVNAGQPAYGQTMASIVNSLEDDSMAHPWDDPDTDMIDETMDGICEDELGRCTLRAALEEASYLGANALVSFDAGLSGNLAVDDANGPFFPPDFSIIQGVRQKVILYGSNPASSLLLSLGNGVTVTGLGFAHGLIGVLIAGDNNLVGADQSPLYSNYFHDFSQNGIIILGNNNNISGNRIGIAFDNTPIGNQYGIFITGSDNTIGGTLPGKGNIISGNNIGIGVYAIDGGINYIYGNKIGTDSSGTIAVGNRVGIDNIGPGLSIGNDTPEGMNLISGNTESGILTGIDGDGCSIFRNYIGTDISGTFPIPNRDGITLGPGANDCIVQSNLIMGNTQFGILVSGIPDSALTSHDHLILDNTITQNGIAGIALNGAANDNVIGSSLTVDYAPNTIHDNGQAGVVIVGTSSDPQRNTIRENSFHDNNSHGIRILSGQGSIQPPELVSYTDDGQGVSTILGTHSLAGAVIDLYAGDSNQSNRQEGVQWLGSGTVDLDGFFTMQISSCPCDSIVATATDVLGNTSEFSDGWGLTTALYEPEHRIGHLTAFPNPFHDETTIEVELQHPEDIELGVFDMHGRKVKTLCDQHLFTGTHQWSWIPESSAEGVYYYRITSGTEHVTTGKLMLIR